MTWLTNGSKNHPSVLVSYKIILFSISQWTAEAFYKDVLVSLWKCQFFLTFWILGTEIQNSKINFFYLKTIIIILLFYFSFSKYTHLNSYIKHTFCQMWSYCKHELIFRHLSDFKKKFPDLQKCLGVSFQWSISLRWDFFFLKSGISLNENKIENFNHAKYSSI